ncbi:MAG: enoyl-CoA hydratase/isomerase [Methylococcales bacterium]|nr:enoyl-CoA hydratase/isomerase [Methylococcales bacterium]
MNYQTIQVRFDQSVCYLKLYRPQANNCINKSMIEECQHALAACGDSVHIVVLEGLPDIFCLGADFQELQTDTANQTEIDPVPEYLYHFWTQLAHGPFISIAHVRGKVNAGGVGFVAACDIVLADKTAEFSLSELLFGLFPACVMPFLIRRIGFQKAHYMALTTKPVAIQQALEWGLVDASEHNSDTLLRKHLLRLNHLSKSAIQRYKTYMNSLDDILTQARPSAIAANRKLFSDPTNLEKIDRYTRTGLFPWES